MKKDSLKKYIRRVSILIIFQLLQINIYGQNACVPNGQTQLTVNGQCYDITNTCTNTVMVPDNCSLTNLAFEDYLDNNPCLTWSTCYGFVNVYQYYNASRQDHWYTTSTTAPSVNGQTYVPGSRWDNEEFVTFKAHNVQAPGSIPIYNIFRDASVSCTYCPNHDHYLTQGTSNPSCNSGYPGCPYVGWSSGNAWPNYTSADIAFYAYTSAVTVDGVTAVPIRSFYGSQSSGRMDHYFKVCPNCSSCGSQSGYSCESNIRFYAFPP